jgi:hypothetical protein
MVMLHKPFMFILLMIMFMPLFCGQAGQRTTASAQGVDLVVGPLDAYSRAFGLDDEKIYQEAAAALRSKGFRIDESSDIALSVSISSFEQFEEDLLPFSIEVHAGTKPEIARERKREAEVITDIPAVRNIQEARNSDGRVRTAVNELVTAVAVKLQKEIARIRALPK